MENKNGYVYRHVRLDTNEPFYIGASCPTYDKYKRRSRDRTDREKEWLEIYNSTEIRVDILFDNLSEEEMYEKEIEFISLYGRVDLGTGTLVNKNNGGKQGLGQIVTDEHKQKISEKLKGRVFSEEHKEKIAKSLTGRIRSEEERKSMSIGQRNKKPDTEETKMRKSKAVIGNKNPFYGKTHSKETLAKMSKQIIDLATGKIYVSIKLACEELELSYGMTKRKLSGKIKNDTTLKYYGK